MAASRACCPTSLPSARTRPDNRNTSSHLISLSAASRVMRRWVGDFRPVDSGTPRHAAGLPLYGEYNNGVRDRAYDCRPTVAHEASLSSLLFRTGHVLRVRRRPPSALRQPYPQTRPDQTVPAHRGMRVDPGARPTALHYLPVRYSRTPYSVLPATCERLLVVNLV